jgi:hypothetical protein
MTFHFPVGFPLLARYADNLLPLAFCPSSKGLRPSEPAKMRREDVQTSAVKLSQSPQANPRIVRQFLATF